MAKYRRKIQIIALLLLGGVLIYRYGFLFIMWFTTPVQDTISKSEKHLFDEIKKELNVKDIERAPRYNLSEAKDTISYDLFLKDLDCEKEQKLDSIAKNIAIKVHNQLSLSEKVYKIEIIFECKNSTVISVKHKFIRKNL